MVAISHEKVNGPGETTVVPCPEGFKISKNSAQFIMSPVAWWKYARMNRSLVPCGRSVAGRSAGPETPVDLVEFWSSPRARHNLFSTLSLICR